MQLQEFHLNSLFGFFVVTLTFLASISNQAECQELPAGYIVYYSQKANTPDFLKTLIITPNRGFSINKEKTFAVLNYSSEDSTKLTLPPACRGIISDKIFGEFIMEFEFRIQSGSQFSLSGFYFLCPVKSDKTYYATIFSADSISFLVAKSGNIIKKEGTPARINSDWNRVRIQRNILNREVNITMNGDTKNSISFTDRDLVMGFVGFGTHETSSYLRNIKIWAPTAFSDTLYHSE